MSGAAGFLGSHLIDLLLSQGHEVIGIDSFITGRAENVAHLTSNPRFDLVRADITDLPPIDGPLGRIYHLASPASPVGHE